MDELLKRMEKEHIKMFELCSEDEGQVAVVEAPKRILDIESKEILFYMLVKKVKDLKKIKDCEKPEELQGDLECIIIDEETAYDMMEQTERRFRDLKDKSKNENMYI